MTAAERLRRAVAAEPVAGLPITVSVGVCVTGSDAVDLTDLLRSADVALYRAKRGGRDRVVAVPTPGTATVPSRLPVL